MQQPSVYDRFRETAHRWPDRAFVNVLPETARAYGIAPGERLYGTSLIHIDDLINVYKTAGYGNGHRVGLLLENRPDFLHHWLALNALGTGIVPINPDLRAAELTYLIQHADLALAVTVPGRAANLRAANPDLNVITPGETPAEATPANAAPTQDPECALLYTSGTTGHPKGCVLTNSYFLHAGDWYASVGGHLSLHEDPPERLLTPLPLFHVNALAFSAMAMMTVGGCLTVLDRFHPATWWHSVNEADATIIHYLGIMPPLLMKRPEVPEERAHSVRTGFGAGIDPKLHEAAEARFGFPFVEGWAMTETGAGGVIMATEEPRKPGTGCFGRPRGGVEARVVTEDGREAKADEPGELLVRRAGADARQGFFHAYLKDPEATREAWAGGWLHTGDVVSRDADGDFRFIDRKKNVIRRSGENISAVEVESVLARHKGVRAVAVARVPDDLRGEEVLALVVPDGPLEAGELTDWALTEMAYYKAPGWVAKVDSLPVTATEKLQRGAIADLATTVMAEGRAEDLRALKKPAR